MEVREDQVTSKSLIKVLGKDAVSPRWTEFADKYALLIDGFLGKYFPTVDAAEVVNETLIALVEKLPLYQYDPDEKGHFRNYLLGIVRYKAIEQLKRRKRYDELKQHVKDQAFEWTCQARSYKADLSDWQKDAYEAALQQFFANPDVSTRAKEIFRRIIRRGEKPEDVASVFGIMRNNVDQIMARTREKLKKLALQYADICNG